MSNVQQGCHVHRGCHVHCPLNRGCHVQCPTGAVMSIVQQGLSCPLSNMDVMPIVHHVVVLSKFQQCRVQWNISISITCELYTSSPFE